MPDLDRKIIVSADDFGQSSKANANILELLSLKKLQRISIMIDGNFSPEEIRLLINSHVKIDLHLDLFNLLENSWNKRIKAGAFSRLLNFFKDYLSEKISVLRVASNWTRQLEKFRTIFGKYPDGLNSHEHIHFFPPYFKLILALAEKSKITYLRFGKKDFVKITNVVSFIIFCLRKINRQYFKDSGLNSADFLISLDWLKKNGWEKSNNLLRGTTELIVHPEREAELFLIKNRF
jgi:predicted glycoside hydrolase/deacetylase ChbG (UPF0249 family)